MNPKYLFALWGGLFALCAALGFIPQPTAALKVLMTLLSLAFFIPGAMLLHQNRNRGNRFLAVLVRNLSAASLILTALLIIVNFLSAFASAFWGNVFYSILIIVSSPMVCSQYWALSLFLWACLMITAAKQAKAKS